MEFVHETVDLGYEDLVADTRKSGRTYSTPDGTRFRSIKKKVLLLGVNVLVKKQQTV